MNMNTSVIKGLILKDLYNLKKSFKFLLPFFAVYAVISLSSGDFSITTALMTTVTIMIPLYTFSYDQYSRWNDFALTMPISRKTLVTARYMLALIMVGITALLILLAELISRSYDPSELHDSVLVLLFTVSALLLFLSIICVCVYRFDLERARFVIIGVCLLPLALLLFFLKLLPPETTSAIRGWFLSQRFLGIIGLDTAIWIGALLFLVFSILCMYASWKTSVRIMEKKEF